MCVGSSLDMWESMGLSMAEISSKRLMHVGNCLDIWEMD